MPSDYALYSPDLRPNDWVLYDILTPFGTISQAFLGQGSICMMLGEQTQAKDFYPSIREALHAVRVLLIVPGKGLYQAQNDSFQALAEDDDLAQLLERCLGESPPCYSLAVLHRIRRTLIQLNAQTRGYHKASDGTLYVLHHGVFCKASPADTVKIMQLCLRAGFFGFHRFALGKWLSGLIYALTCGFFLLGWFMDLFELFFGVMRDNRKRLLFPLKDVRGALKKLPCSLLTGALTLAVYVCLFHFLLHNPSFFWQYLKQFPLFDPPL